MQGIIPYLVYILATIVPTVTVQPVAPEITQPEVPVYVETVAPSITMTPVVVTPEPMVQSYQTNSVESWIAASQWPSQFAGTVARIISCESGGNPGAISPGGYVGLMQIAPWFHGYQPSDPVGQLNQAYEVYLKQGWNAWSCY
jgi:hypothetical protein